MSKSVAFQSKRLQSQSMHFHVSADIRAWISFPELKIKYPTTVNSAGGSNSARESAVFFHAASRLYQWRCREVHNSNEVTLVRSEPCLLCIKVLAKCQFPHLDNRNFAFLDTLIWLPSLTPKDKLPNMTQCFSLTFPVDFCFFPGFTA